jgi:hypothetical protein
MLGYYFAEEFSPGGRESDTFRLNAFLKFEQLSGYARWHVNKDGELRGIREVRRRLAEEDRITIAADSSGQIMSNQKTYGLWGLYTMPARASGLIADDVLQLTPVAREFTERHALRTLTRALPDAVTRIREIIQGGRAEVIPEGRDVGLLKALAKALRPEFEAAELGFYRQYLVCGGQKAPEWQPVFARLVEDHLPKAEDFCLKHVVELVKQARRIGESALADQLDRIRALEALLVPTAALFAYAQSRDGATTKSVAQELEHVWIGGLPHIDPTAIADLASVIDQVYGDHSASIRFHALATALASGDFGESLRLCLEHNAFVMRSRSGAEPWILVKRNLLDVRYRDEGTAPLVSGKEIAKAWQNSFYLAPVKWFVDQLRVA